MVEKTILNFLKEKGVKAYMEEVENMPESFVLIEKLGSSESNYVQSSLVAIQSFSSTLYKTAALNEKVKEIMRDIIELDDITGCQINSDYNYPDVTRKRYRYQAVFDIFHY